MLVVLMGMVLTCGIASAHTIDVDPTSQEMYISPDSNATYQVTVDCIGTIDAGSHDISIMFYNDTGHSTDKLTGTLTSSDVALTPGTSTASMVSYSWNAPGAGTYDFNLTVEINETASEPPVEGEEFGVYIVDNDADTSFSASLTASATTIPELFTAALLGLGLVSIVALTRK